MQVMNAFARTQGLTVYHAQLDMVMTDPSGSIPAAIPGEPFTLMTMEGRTNQDAQQFLLKGYILTILGGDPERGIEFITVADKVYIHGPFPHLGAMQARWYVSPRAQAADLESANPKNVFGDFGSAPLPAMRALETIALDGTSCTIYQGDERAALEYFANLDPKGNLKNAIGRAGSQIEKGLLSVTVCKDGYVHGLELGLFFRVNARPAQTGSLTVKLRLNDMNVIVPIQEPADALPLPKPLTFPSQDTPNPQPHIAPTPFRFPTFVVPTFPSF